VRSEYSVPDGLVSLLVSVLFVFVPFMALYHSDMTIFWRLSRLPGCGNIAVEHTVPLRYAQRAEKRYAVDFPRWNNAYLATLGQAAERGRSRGLADLLPFTRPSYHALCVTFILHCGRNMAKVKRRVIVLPHFVGGGGRFVRSTASVLCVTAGIMVHNSA